PGALFGVSLGGAPEDLHDAKVLVWEDQVQVAVAVQIGDKMRRATLRFQREHGLVLRRVSGYRSPENRAGHAPALRTREHEVEITVAVQIGGAAAENPTDRQIRPPLG